MKFWRRIPSQSRRTQRVAVDLEVGVGRRGAVGQHHVQTVQRQVGEQLGEFVFGANQAQMRLGHHRLQQPAHRQLGQAV